MRGRKHPKVFGTSSDNNITSTAQPRNNNMAARNNRGRPSIMKEDISDESQLWQSILEKMRRAAAANKAYEELTPKFAAAEDKLVNSDSKCNVVLLRPLTTN